MSTSNPAVGNRTGEREAPGGGTQPDPPGPGRKFGPAALVIGMLRRYGLVGTLLILLLVLVGMPIGTIILTSLLSAPPRPGAGLGSPTLEHFQSLVTAPQRSLAIWNSIKLSASGTALAMVFGCGLAWLTARTDVPARKVVHIAAIAPLFMSGLVGALAWALLASPRSGFLNLVLQAAGLPLTLNIQTQTGIVLVFGLYYAPYAYLLVYGALALMNPELEEAAEVHRANGRRVLRKVTFPLVMPAVLGSAILIMMLVIENFSIPAVLGSPVGIPLMTTQIWALVSRPPSRANEAAALGLVLMVLTIAFVYGQRKLLGGRDYATVSGKGFRPRVIKLGRARWFCFAGALGYLTLAVILPFFALFQTALRSHLFIPDLAALFDFGAFSFDSFVEAWRYPSTLVGLRNSIWLGISVAVIGGLLHFTLSYVVYRTRLPGRRWLEYLAMSPLGVPAMIIGLGFLWSWIRLPIPIYGTLIILMLAYVARFMPQGFRGISATIRQVHPDLEDCAVVCGASRVGAVARVTLPLIRTGVISAMFLLLMLSMRELSVTLFLFTTNTRVLPIVILEQWQFGNPPRLAAISLMYSGLLLLVAIATRRWSSSISGSS